MIIGIVVLVVALAVVLDASSSPTTLTASTNVYVDSHLSSCKGGGTFSCTIVLDATQGAVSVAEVTSVTINGTVTQPDVTASGGAVTIVATLPGITMVRGLGDVGSSQRPPSVGTIVVGLSDGTSVSVVLGAGGVLP